MTAPRRDKDGMRGVDVPTTAHRPLTDTPGLREEPADADANAAKEAS